MHLSRIKPYADSLVGAPVELAQVAEFADRAWSAVLNINNVRETSEGFEVLGSWKGLSPANDSWEPLSVLYEDLHYQLFYWPRLFRPVAHLF